MAPAAWLKAAANSPLSAVSLKSIARSNSFLEGFIHFYRLVDVTKEKLLSERIKINRTYFEASDDTFSASGC